MIGLDFTGPKALSQRMAIIRIILVWLLILNPLAMLSTGVASDALPMATACHDVMPPAQDADRSDTAHIPVDIKAKHCTGAKCCVMTEAKTIFFTIVQRPSRLTYATGMRAAHIQIAQNRPDKPPQLI